MALVCWTIRPYLKVHRMWNLYRCRCFFSIQGGMEDCCFFVVVLPLVHPQWQIFEISMSCWRFATWVFVSCSWNKVFAVILYSLTLLSRQKSQNTKWAFQFVIVTFLATSLPMRPAPCSSARSVVPFLFNNFWSGSDILLFWWIRDNGVQFLYQTVSQSEEHRRWAALNSRERSLCHLQITDNTYDHVMIVKLSLL